MTRDRSNADPRDLATAYARMRRTLSGILTIAVTGTKGKTSICEFIGQLMEARGLLTAVSTTESARIGGRHQEPCDTGQDLYAFAARCRRAHVECLVVELASTALAWNIHHAFDIDVAVMSNIGTDHLRFHRGRRNYVAVKRRLFRDLRTSADSPNPVAILNAGDAYVDEFAGSLAPGVTAWAYAVGRRPPANAGAARLWATEVAHDASGTSFTIHGVPGGPLACRTPLHGAFNVSNALAAIACDVALGGDPRDAVARASALAPPAGRFELAVAPSDRHAAIVVDYAHTPESVTGALAAARDVCPGGRIHVVFGCGGDCYKGKRGQMGAAASRGADAITLTSDNPRTEDPGAIAKAILAGIPPAARRRVRIELDRAAAIRSAVRAAAPGDLVLLLGKGSETTQEAGGRTSRFSDLRMARRTVAHGADDEPPAKPFDAESAVLLDASGDALLAFHADLAHPPASLAKLMTLYLACEDVARGRARLADRVAISGYAALTPHPRLACRAGERLRLRVLLEATAIRSSNLAATAVAEHLAGSEAAFVTRMNERARALGLTATRFETCHGLTHPRQQSTARDLARLLLRLLRDHPAAGVLLRAPGFTHAGRRYVRDTPNVRAPGGIDGLKTGYTDDAGYNLAVAAHRGRTCVVAVVLGCSTRAGSLRDAGWLVRYGLTGRADALPRTQSLSR